MAADAAGVHVRIRLGAESYALAVEHVREILVIDRATPVPGAPPAIVGLQDVHGAIVPVVDPGLIFGTGTSVDGHAVLVEAAGIRAALLVDEVSGVEPLNGTLQPRDEPCLHGAVLQDGELIGVVDVTAVLDAVRAR